MSAGKNFTARKGPGIAEVLAGRERDEKGRIPQLWTLETALHESNKYNNRSDFRTYSNSAYQYLVRKKALNRLTIPYGSKSYRVDLFDVFCAIKKCKTRGEMRVRFPAEYHATRNHEMARKAFEDHFGKGKTNKYWSHEKSINEAKKFTTRSEFMRLSCGAYEYVKKHRLDQLAFSHMEKKQSDFDCIYVWAKLSSNNKYTVKIGVTSKRLGLERIRFVAKKSKLIPDIVWLVGCENALKAEKVMKKIGCLAGMSGFNGSSEFYSMNEKQFFRCKRIMKWLSKGLISGLKNEREELLRLMQEPH